MGDSRTKEEVERQFTDKDKLGIDNSIAAHIRWHKAYKALVEHRVPLNISRIGYNVKDVQQNHVPHQGQADFEV